MAFGALVIGDEILVGKRQDKHLAFIIQALAKRGLRLPRGGGPRGGPRGAGPRPRPPLHPGAERETRARLGGEATPQRLKMGEFPAGAEIIPNPFNQIPGFSIREHWFVPGFPQMAWPMLEWGLG